MLGSFGWLGHQRVHIYDIGFYSWVSEDNLRHQTDPIADTILRERDLLRNECDRMVENLSLLSNELVKDGAGRIARKIDRIIGVDTEPSIVLRKNITRETLLDSLHRIADGLDIKVVSIAFNYAESDSVELVVQSKSGRFHSTIVKITDVRRRHLVVLVIQGMDGKGPQHGQCMTDNLFYIFYTDENVSDEEGALWWKPNRSGYTRSLNNAGLYSESEARFIERIRGKDVAVPREIAEKFSVRIVPRESILRECGSPILRGELKIKTDDIGQG